MFQKSNNEQHAHSYDVFSLESLVRTGADSPYPSEPELGYANDALARALNEVEQITAQILSRETEFAKAIERASAADERIRSLEARIADEEAKSAEIKANLRLALRDRWRIEAEV